MHGKVVKGQKKHENSSKTTAQKQTHPTIRLGEQHTFKQEIKPDHISSSLPTSHPSKKPKAQKVLPTFMRYLFLPKHPISPFFEVPPLFNVLYLM